MPEAKTLYAPVYDEEVEQNRPNNGHSSFDSIIDGSGLGWWQFLPWRRIIPPNAATQ